MSHQQKQIVIIGGGPGGYPAAIKAAQLGADVTLIDRNGLGGTCLHRGCIPTKYLLKAAKEYEIFSRMQKQYDNPVPPPNMNGTMKHKAEIVGKLAGGTAMLLKNNGVKVIKGTAAFVDEKHIRIEETGEIISSSAFIIASGSEGIRLNVEGIELDGVYDSNTILDIDRIPDHLTVVGGGYIGLEFAQIFKMFGARVTVLELLNQILPEIDPDVSTAMQKIFNFQGIDIHTGCKLKRIQRVGDALRLIIENKLTKEEIQTDAVLMAVGRRPRLQELGLERIGVRMTPMGAIDVNSYLQTNIPGIYAVGDVVGGMMLAHKATAEGENAVVSIVKGPKEMSYEVVPSVMYTFPEMAAVGLSESQAREKYGEILVGQFPMAASGRAVLAGAQQGFVKVVAELDTEVILGASFVCPEAGHLVGEAALAIQMEATLDDIAETIHAHPTLSEAFREAALDARGEAIHLPPC
jgi:dihydrolipoamide dehydrogenase